MGDAQPTEITCGADDDGKVREVDAVRHLAAGHDWAKYGERREAGIPSAAGNDRQRETARGDDVVAEMFLRAGFHHRTVANSVGDSQGQQHDHACCSQFRTAIQRDVSGDAAGEQEPVPIEEPTIDPD